MNASFRKAGWFLRSEDGPSGTEYAILLAMIAMFAIAALSQFGDHISGIYSAVERTMPDA